MARPKPPQRPRRSAVKIVILVLVCSLIGGAIVYQYGDRIRGLAKDARASKLLKMPAGRTEAKAKKGAEAKGEGSAAAKQDGDAPAKAKKTEQEREMERLREELIVKERENSEMKIQLKLLKEGSRTGTKE